VAVNERGGGVTRIGFKNEGNASDLKFFKNFLQQHKRIIDNIPWIC
jgi:hypothetical protein